VILNDSLHTIPIDTSESNKKQDRHRGPQIHGQRPKKIVSSGSVTNERVSHTNRGIAVEAVCIATPTEKTKQAETMP